MTAQPITVSLLGEPVAFARMRIAARTGAHFVPAPQRNAMAALRIEAANTMLHMGASVLDEPVSVELLAELPIPASWSKKRRNLAILGYIRPATRPDIDNIFKLMADAFNGVIWRDDVLVVDVHMRKIYGLQPKLVVTVKPVTVGQSMLAFAIAEAAA
jgi:Holliday junction resolvase RusA-like endonuclease